MTTVADLKGQTVAFAASGGLDSCTITKWLTENGVKVVCFTAGIAQPDESNFDEIEKRMRACGAADYVALPLHEMIAESGIEVIQFQARYEGAYWNTTGIGRHVIVAGTIPEMRKRGIKVLSHGATGRGNDQVSITGAFAGIAETGTLVMASGPDHPVTLNLLPDTHIVVLREADIVIVEGAGAASEVNLRTGDIANMGFARASGTPVVIVGDMSIRKGIVATIPDMPWINDAPAFLVFVANGERLPLACKLHGKPFPNDHLDAFFNATVDAAIVLTIFINAATLVGLGCCPISAIRDHPETVGNLLRLPQRAVARREPRAHPARG